MKGRKRATGLYYPEIDDCTLKWFKQAHNRNIFLNGPLARAKACEFASILGINQFKASVGWLDKFKERHNIVFKSIHNDIRNFDVNDVNDWTNKLIGKIQETNTRVIFNVNETAFFSNVHKVEPRS